VLLRTQPDARLVAMSRDGGVAAFDEIVRRHESALTAYATMLAPPSRMEDVIQESLLKAYAALQDGAQPDVLRAWLFRIVRNTAIDEHRKVRHHEQLDENYDGVEQPPQAFERGQQLAALVAAIADLPPAQREAIVMRELEGRGHEEISRSLSVSPGAVRQLIFRARDSLREAASALIPAAVIRTAAVPGADSAVGGIGVAGAVKLGVAAVVATGTIVAGTSIERHHSDAKAEASPLVAPRAEGQDSAATPAAATHPRSNGNVSAAERNPSSRTTTTGRHSNGSRAPAAPVGDAGTLDQGSADSGPSGSSGPGSDDSGSEDNSGPGSGASGSGDDGGSETEGPSGSGTNSGGDGGGSGDEGPDGGSGSGGDVSALESHDSGDDGH